MKPKDNMRHALLLKYGRFELAAYGLPALIVLLSAMLLAARWFQIL